MESVNGVIFTAIAMKLFLAIVSIVVVFGMLRLRDKMIGIKFRTIVRGMSHDAFALYAGLSFLGACIVVGAALF